MIIVHYTALSIPNHQPMLRTLCTTIALITTIAASAQSTTDGFIITPKEGGWGVLHTVKAGENATSISHAFHVPASSLAEANMLLYTDSLRPGRRLYIPLSSHNQKTALPKDKSTVRKLYYRVRNGENLKDIAALAKVPVATLQAWNHLSSATVSPGTTLQVGWILYSAQALNTGQSGIVVTEETPKYVMNGDTPKTHTGIHTGGPLYRDSTTGIVPPLQVLWNEQTMDGKNVVTEKGSAGFFQLAGNAAGASTYAFHSAAAKGTVIKVKNIANGRYIFVKVLGPVPNTKQYYGCQIGLSNAAKTALGVREAKAFVELSYAGY